MKNTWQTGVPKNDTVLRDERRQLVLSHKPVLDLLTQILNKKIREKERLRDSEEFHSEYQYSVHQAKCAGELKALRELSALCNLKED